MSVVLKKHYEDLLQAEVAAGRFASVDDAVAFALDHFLPVDVDKLDWAKSAVDEGRASGGSGAGRSMSDMRAKLQVRIERLERK